MHECSQLGSKQKSPWGVIFGGARFARPTQGTSNDTSQSTINSTLALRFGAVSFFFSLLLMDPKRRPNWQSLRKYLCVPYAYPLIPMGINGIPWNYWISGKHNEASRCFASEFAELQFRNLFPPAGTHSFYVDGLHSKTLFGEFRLCILQNAYVIATVCSERIRSMPLNSRGAFFKSANAKNE